MTEIKSRNIFRSISLIIEHWVIIHFFASRLRFRMKIKHVWRTLPYALCRSSAWSAVRFSQRGHCGRSQAPSWALPRRRCGRSSRPVRARASATPPGSTRPRWPPGPWGPCSSRRAAAPWGAGWPATIHQSHCRRKTPAAAANTHTKWEKPTDRFSRRVREDAKGTDWQIEVWSCRRLRAWAIDKKLFCCWIKSEVCWNFRLFTVIDHRDRHITVKFILLMGIDVKNSNGCKQY